MALVFALHGYSGTAASFENRTGFNRIADREGFILVYPNAVPFGPKQKQLWNGGGIYEIWWAGRVDDVDFFAKLIDTVSADYTIDPNRIFVFGNSSGGFMAHHLGARLPGRFAAIAPWGSLLAFNDFVAGTPVSVIHFHGGQDEKVLYDGLPNWGFYGVENGVRLWAARNGCKSAPIVVKDDPNTLVQRWAAPNGAGDVVLYKLKNQGHSMPTPPNYNLPEIAWAFFKNHPRSNVQTQLPESQSPAVPFAVGPYLGQSPPGSTAQVFAPGLICDTRPYQWESHGQFSADGNTFCFNRLRYVYITENTDQGWTKPKRIERIPYHSYSCCLSPDANSIYVRSGPFNGLKQRRSPNLKGMCLRRCMRTSQGWSLPQEIGPPFSTSGQRAGFSVSGDNSIYFKSRRGGFWVAPFVGNTWNQAIEIPIKMGNLRGCCPGIAPDDSFLVFYSVKPGAQLGTETNLYLTLRGPDGSWTKPRNMGPKINSMYYEHGARISPDKKYMFFTRSTGWNLRAVCDTGDIYWVELKEYLPESYR
jgi:polyhydroxybutyrate depolymerase